MFKRKYFCDDCGHSFRLKRLAERRLPRGIIHTYFKCPECRTQYHVSYTNKQIRKLHERINFMRERLKLTIIKKEHDLISAELAKMVTESRRLMTELKREMTREDG